MNYVAGKATGWIVAAIMAAFMLFAFADQAAAFVGIDIEREHRSVGARVISYDADAVTFAEYPTTADGGAQALEIIDALRDFSYDNTPTGKGGRLLVSYEIIGGRVYIGSVTIPGCFGSCSP